MSARPSRFEKALASKIKRRAKCKPCGNFAGPFALFGIVGWSIAVPSILAAMFGRWVDARYGGGYAFTLPLIVLGIVSGSVNAWRCISKELEK